MDFDDATALAARPFDLKLEGKGNHRAKWVTVRAMNGEPR